MDALSISNGNNTLGGETNESIYRTYAERQINSAATFVASFVGFFGNLTVICAILAVKKLQTTTNVFVLNLAVADVLTCTVSPLQALTVLHDELLIPSWLCKLVAFCLITCIGCSINCLACIAVNRLVGITTKADSMYRRLYTPGKLTIMVALTWFVPMTVAILPLLFDYAEYGYNTIYNSCAWRSNKSYTFIYAMLLAVAFFPVQFVILFTSYLRIFLYVRKTSRSTLYLDGSGQTNRGNDALQRQIWNRQVAVTKNLFLVVCVFFFCLSPYFLMQGLPAEVTRSVLTYTSTILMINSSVNPIIYATRHPDFRAVFVSKVHCWKNSKNRTKNTVPSSGQGHSRVETTPDNKHVPVLAGAI